MTDLIGLPRLGGPATNVDAILRDARSDARRCLDAQEVRLLLLNEAGDELWEVTNEQRIRPLSDAETQNHRPALSAPVVLDDLQLGAESIDPPGWPSGSRLRVPVCVRGGKVLGVLEVAHTKADRYQLADAQVLSVVASRFAAELNSLRATFDASQSCMNAVRMLVELIEKRDAKTSGHSERVACYAVGIGQALGLSDDDLSTLSIASLLHDLGKIAIPDAILLKSGALDASEYKTMQSHATMTRQILEQGFYFKHEANIPFLAGAHHERLDGSGYPDGLRGAEIPLLARIVAVADVYDAVTSKDRLYRQAGACEQGFAILQADAGTRLDADVVRHFRESGAYQIERRRSARVSPQATIVFSVERRDEILAASHLGAVEQMPGEAAPLRDISSTGLRFSTPDYLPVGTHLSLQVGLGGEDLRVRGRVMRLERSPHPSGFLVGVHLLFSKGRERLERYLAQWEGAENAGDGP